MTKEERAGETKNRVGLMRAHRIVRVPLVLKGDDEWTNQSEAEATMLLVARFRPPCF